MKVSIDGILGSAQKINSQKKLDDEGPNNRKGQVKADSVTISNKINSRLDSIEGELRDLQSSLTKNQIIHNGIQRLQRDLAQDGGANRQAIMNEVTYEGNPVLPRFLGDTVDEATLNTKQRDVEVRVNDDVNRLRRMQVELDNMMASDLVGQESLQGIMDNMESLFGEGGYGSLENISSLNADTVMRLIK